MRTLHDRMILLLEVEHRYPTFPLKEVFSSSPLFLWCLQAGLASRRGAAFGFAGIAKKAGAALAPHTAALVPKLYRMQYDPSPGMRDAMGHIWRALVAEPKKATDEHFPAIMEDLLTQLGARMWRSREAAGLALSDLLQGRRWDEVRGNQGPDPSRGGDGQLARETLGTWEQGSGWSRCLKRWGVAFGSGVETSRWLPLRFCLERHPGSLACSRCLPCTS